MKNIKLFDSAKTEDGLIINDYMQYWVSDFPEIRSEIIENPNYLEIFGEEKTDYELSDLNKWEDSQDVSHTDKIDLLWQVFRKNPVSNKEFVGVMNALCPRSKDRIKLLGYIDDSEYKKIKEIFGIPDFDIRNLEKWRVDFHGL